MDRDDRGEAVKEGRAAFIRKLARRDDLSAVEIAELQGLQGRIRDVRAGEDIIALRAHVEMSSLLLWGVCGRYSAFRDGPRRFTEINVPGDFIDLHGFVMKQLDHGVLAFSDCRILEVPHSHLRDLTRKHPHLARLLWLETVVDAAIHRQWLLSTGQNGPARLGRLLCELYVRLEQVGLASRFQMHLPMTQQQMGEALGFSLVHVNRTVQVLRRNRLLSWRGQVLELLDWERLVALSEFDPTYLRLHKEKI
ncbi:Crp/Fnr family transcriptional regulator [Caulobacter flavus]|uniref:Crp/Fnr family transcriptional regulator n=1 Tax=Caulobacter flavus TaxID=1679497 RepID=A0A2N5CXA3_9CAUL|nr:Crp/Fnr family transcriptional regulator [Caulobacter flavus]AYV49602.1 Crp/Fnr family transcriptional regulator [Caulobacter flavus]PLR18447.1 Crp/Fnr family transcriptional regulator [Caulobacter flavus]